MRKMFVILVVLLSVEFSVAQTKKTTPSQIQKFKASTTFVVLEENPFSIFNASIKECLALCWKITPYKIITAAEFVKMKTDPSKSFLYISYAEITKTKTSLFDANTGLFDNVDKFRYNLLNLVLGDKSGNLNQMPDIASLPLSYVAPILKNEEDAEETDYAYKIGGILRLMQFYVDWLVKNPDQSFDQLMEAYTSEVRTKEIWVTKEDLGAEVNAVEKIAKVYPFPVKIVTAAAIETAIRTSNPSVVFVHKIGPEKFKLKDAVCFITLIDCVDGKPYYFGYHKVKSSGMDGLMLTDFKKLAK